MESPQQSYDLSNLTDLEAIQLVIDLLNYNGGYEVKATNDPKGPDFIYEEKNEIVVIGMVLHTEIFDESSYDNLLHQVNSQIGKYTPNQYWLVSIFPSTPKWKERLQANISIPEKTTLMLWDESKLQIEIRSLPESVLTKYNLKLKSESDEIQLGEAEMGSADFGGNASHTENSDEDVRKYYVAGHTWKTEDGIVSYEDEFINEDYWEHGRGEEYTELVNSIERGDVLFMKSTFAYDGDSILRIKAYGIVKSNPRNGHLLDVLWTPIDQLDFAGFGYLRDSIQAIESPLDDLILSRLGYDRSIIGEIVPDVLIDHERNEGRGPIEIDVEHFQEKYSDFANSEEFFYEKADEIYYELRHYDEVNGFADKEEIEKAAVSSPLTPYRKLQELWNNRDGVKPSEFEGFLIESGADDMVFLYNEITKLIAYIDYNAWNKQVLNEYEDKRVVANSGARQTHLVSHFIDRAVQGFSNVPEQSELVLHRALDYLDWPNLMFNILSSKHRKLISKYFLGRVFTGMEFHSELKDYFDGLGFSIFNARNATCFYTRVIYDPEIRKLWAEGVDPDPEKPIEPLSEPIVSQDVQQAMLNNDGAYTSKDLLDIENDVRSFAMILASKTIKPPVAVALFGKWGSGKSYFMKHLSGHIETLGIHQGFPLKGRKQESQDKNDDLAKYCQGVAQISFNAWSYLDSNLWAGLVSSIFEKLNEYLTKTTKSGIAKLKVEEKLTKRLNALNAIRDGEFTKAKRLQRLRDGYSSEKLRLENEVAKNIGSKLLEFTEANEALEKIHSDLFNDEQQLAENFKLVGVNIVSEYKFWSQFYLNIKTSKFYLTYLWLVGISLGAACLFYYFQPFSNWLTSLSLLSLWSPGLMRLRKVGRIYSKAKGIAKTFNTEVEKNSGLKNSLENLQKEIEMSEKLKIEADRKIKELDQEIKESESQLSSDLTQIAIGNFINERVSHEDYHKNQGIISVIRRDFETLSELFVESEEKNKPHPETDQSDELDKDREEILSQFKPNQQLERVILYIDDLDRCSDEKVLEIIQAVHLLMAFPLFNVVVGVDRRCVSNALISRNLLEYGKYLDVERVEEYGIQVISPDEYLEKIFQIPFQLKAPSDKSLKDMVDFLLKGQIGEEPKDEKERESRRSAMKDSAAFTRQAPRPEVNADAFEEEEGSPFESDTDDERKETPEAVLTPKNLLLTPTEKVLLKQFVWLVGKTPRTLKRFINIYKIVRGHESLKMKTSERKETYKILMFLLALQIGDCSKHASKIIKRIAKNDEATLQTVCNELLSKTEKEENEMLKFIEDGLEKSGELKELLDLKCDAFAAHIPFISRFSFISQDILS